MCLFNDAARSSKYRQEWQNKWTGKNVTFSIPRIIIHLLQLKPTNEHKILLKSQEYRKAPTRTGVLWHG
jgi:hypothetical protein